MISIMVTTISQHTTMFTNQVYGGLQTQPSIEKKPPTNSAGIFLCYHHLGTLSINTK